MRKTLLLVFIHGFKGGDDTFASFPQHLEALVRHALPNVDVVSLTYPKFETRGELKECVARFRDWLENKVIDIEVAHSTPSPTIDPSVHTILIGHSMGGIVAAETYLLLASETPIPTTSSSMNPETPNFPSNTTLNNSSTGTSHPNPSPSQPHDISPTHFMFPHIQGLLAFDTPFLGLAPSMVAHGIEGGHRIATNAYSTVSEVASVFGWGNKTSSSGVNTSTSTTRALPAPPPPPPPPPTTSVPASSKTDDAAATPKWQSWGKYAMFAGAAGAVAAGGAAALYSQRDKIGAGWGWASSHLLFVGDLARAETLRKRVERMEVEMRDRRGCEGGCANLFTVLGKGAIREDGTGMGRRTFCNLPRKAEEGDGRKDEGMEWVGCVNDKAKDETTAHVGMFTVKDNPGFYALGEKAKMRIVAWVDRGWYAASDSMKGKEKMQTKTTLGGTTNVDGEWEQPDLEEMRKEHADLGKDWLGVDQGEVEEDVKMRDADASKENEELEDSVIVDKAGNGEVPLPDSPQVERAGV